MMKHKIEIAPNLAIYIDGERVIGSKPHGLFLITEMIVSDEDLKRLADRCLEVIPDRKTEKMANDLIRKSDVLETYADLYDIFDDNKAIQEELHKVFDKINNIPSVESNNSEKPNNCDTCKYGEDKHRYAHICNECGVGINNYEPKDEPLTADYCDTCDHKECEYCIADSSNPYCVPSNYHKVEDESTISKMEQVDEPTGYNLSPVEDESQTADVCTWDGKVGEIEIHNILYEPTYNEDDGSM